MFPSTGREGASAFVIVERRVNRTDETSRVERLVAAHLDLPRRIAAMIFRRVRRHVELDELIALGNAGLAQAARSFDEHRGASFKTFAWYRVRGAIIDGVRTLAPLPRRVWRILVRLRQSDAFTSLPIDPRLFTNYRVPFDDNRVCATETVDAAEALDHERLAIYACGALKTLPTTQRELLLKHYWEGKDLLTAGAELGRSKSWASRRHADALDRLRDGMGQFIRPQAA
ncbi:MAG TPA: sigma-70 family RNA polymerase sigma factor [Kofleriaceae bacterium]|jgi:RNA polymerase sigma factor for flagellar operon FliA|nr:sigma-70 family RNA polymerase sigma factor [Kofleriaceae bacterium]